MSMITLLSKGTRTYKFITARNNSCGKVMFSQVCVIPSVQVGGSARGVCLGGLHPKVGGLPRGCLRGSESRRVCIQGGPVSA